MYPQQDSAARTSSRSSDRRSLTCCRNVSLRASEPAHTDTDTQVNTHTHTHTCRGTDKETSRSRHECPRECVYTMNQTHMDTHRVRERDTQTQTHSNTCPPEGVCGHRRREATHHTTRSAISVLAVPPVQWLPLRLETAPCVRTHTHTHSRFLALLGACIPYVYMHACTCRYPPPFYPSICMCA